MNKNIALYRLARERLREKCFSFFFRGFLNLALLLVRARQNGGSRENSKGTHHQEFPERYSREAVSFHLGH